MRKTELHPRKPSEVSPQLAPNSPEKKISGAAGQDKLDLRPIHGGLSRRKCLERNLLFPGSIFRCHVSFQWYNHPKGIHSLNGKLVHFSSTFLAWSSETLLVRLLYSELHVASPLKKCAFLKGVQSIRDCLRCAKCEDQREVPGDLHGLDHSVQFLSKLEMTQSYMFFSYSRMLVLGCSLLPVSVLRKYIRMPNHHLCKARRSSTSKFLHQMVKGLYFKKGCRIFSNVMKKCLQTVIS